MDMDTDIDMGMQSYNSELLEITLPFNSSNAARTDKVHISWYEPVLANILNQGNHFAI